MSEDEQQKRWGIIPSWVHDSGVEANFRELHYAIATVSTPYSGHVVGLYANPNDCRCYRMIIRVLAPSAKEMRINQLQSLEESLAVSTACAILKLVIFSRTALFIQSLHLGNNSMQATVDGGVGLGNAHEPYFYHEHLLARGDPTRSYFDGAPALGGPPLGVAFRAQDTHKPKPSKLELAAIVQGFREILLESKQNDEIWEQAGCSVDVVR